MATIIEQRPLYDILPVGQDVIFTVSNNTIVANETKVKFIAEVHISSQFPVSLGNTNNLIGTFKTTPNNAGVGIFDLRPILENYVKTDNTTASNSEYKTSIPPAALDLPLHLIDKFSGNNNAMKYLAIKFKIEYLGATDCAGSQDDNVVAVACNESQNSTPYKIFNGYLKRSDTLQLIGNNFGFDTSKFQLSSNTDSFLTNAPTTQYANENDYGTITYLTKTLAGTSAANGYVDKIRIECYNSSDVQIGADIDVDRTTANGAYTTYNGYIKMDLLYFGCYPANLRNWSTIFQTQLATGNLAYYSVRGYLGGSTVTKRYIINVNCPDGRGFESIRLTWLNQWGAWDYYTFNKKSIKSLSTKGSTYTQQSGTWNEGTYKLNGYKGGQKSFRVNAIEKIKMNTNFVTEAEGEWFEELINSPEVYVLEGFQTDVSNALLNNYVTPVRLITSSYTRKTIANDKLMQYTFEVEKSKTLRTQSV
jgi:hypothetical protein